MEETTGAHAAGTDGWYGRDAGTVITRGEAGEEVKVSDRDRRKAWVRLLAKVYCQCTLKVESLWHAGNECCSGFA